MSDEHKSYTLVQGASGSELSFTYNAENITIVQLLYHLDEAKKNKDSDAFENLVNISETVFLQDKFSRLPLEDRIRFEKLMEDQANLNDEFYEFKDEVMYEHFPGIQSEFEAYRGLFESARDEIYESKKLAENNELELEKFKVDAELKLIRAKAKEEQKLLKAAEREERKTRKSLERDSRKTMKLQEKMGRARINPSTGINKRLSEFGSDVGKNISKGIEAFMDEEDGFPGITKFTGRFVVPGCLTYLSLLAINHNFDWLMSEYNELFAGSLVGLVSGSVWNYLHYEHI